MVLCVCVCAPYRYSPEGCPKLNPVDDVVVVLLPNPEPNPELCWPKAGVPLWPNSEPPVLGTEPAALVPNENELALPAAGEAPNRPPLEGEAAGSGDAAGWPKPGEAPKLD